MEGVQNNPMFTGIIFGFEKPTKRSKSKSKTLRETPACFVPLRDANDDNVRDLQELPTNGVLHLQTKEDRILMATRNPGFTC